MLRREVAPGMLVIAVVVVIWLATGVAALDIVRFVAYEAAFVALPGAALLWAIRGRRLGVLVTIALGWPAGQALEVLAFFGTAAIGSRELFTLYPIVVIAPSAFVIWRRRNHARLDADSLPMSGAAMWTAAAALSIGLIYLTLMFLPSAPLPGASVVVEYPDYPYFIGLIAQVRDNWPPTTPGLVGVPLSYEWFVLFHIAAASQVTHLPIAIIALRLDYLPTILVLGCQLLVVGRFLGRSHWTGVVAILIFFLLGPLDLTSAPTPFGDDVFVHLWDSWTFPYGMTFFLALLYLIAERLRATTWRSRGDLGSWALIALIMVGGSGAKATVLPVAIVGCGLYVVVCLVIRRAFVMPAVVAATLGALAFVITYAVVYAGTTPATTIDFFVWLSSGPGALYVSLIHHAELRAILLPFAYVADFAGVLLPLAGMLYLVRRRHRRELTDFALPICMFATGLLIVSVVHHSSYSELYFQDTGYMAGCVVAAQGLRLAWLDLGSSLPSSRRAAAVAFATCLMVLILVVKLTENNVATPQTTFLRYGAITAASLGFVVAWAAWRTVRRQHATGVTALALIPALAAAALTSPLLVYPTARAVLAGEPIVTGRTVVVQGLLTALTWLRDKTSVDAVFAVNNHWIDAAQTYGKYYYYTAFSERQAFIEAYNPYPIPPGAGTPAGANFIYRQRLNDAVFDHADVDALRILETRYEVRFLLIDRTLGPYDPAVLQLGRVVLSNHDADIIAVG